MATANLDLAIDSLLAAYARHHPPRVRNLAEMVAEATANFRLQDDNDVATAVFRECVALYCDKHSIALEELDAAVMEYTTVETRAALSS